MHSGMRAYTRKALLSLPFLNYPEGFSFDAELLVDAVTSGLRVVEVPIPTSYTQESSSISISRSLEYVTHGTMYAARRSMARGRRGSRYLPAWRRGVSTRARGKMVIATCTFCGNDRMVLRHPSNAVGDTPTEEFRCTTSALGQHDDIVECPRCGLLSSLPTLTQGEILERYRDVVDEEYLDEEDARRDLFTWITQQMGAYAVRGRSLVEVGANMGLFLSVADGAGWDAVGIEPSAWAVAQGKDRFGVDLREGTVETVDLAAGSTDAMVMLDVLEHLTDPLGALRALRPAMDDEGMLVLSTVNVESLHGRARGGNWPWFIRSHLHYFRPATLVTMLRAAGFETVAWDVVPRSFHLSYVLHRAAGTFPGSGVVEAVATKVDPSLPVGWMGDVTLVVARPVTA